MVVTFVLPSIDHPLQCNGRDKKYRDICVKIFIPTPLPGLNNFDDFILVKFFNYPKKNLQKEGVKEINLTLYVSILHFFTKI